MQTRPGISGSRLVVEGRVLDRHGRPIAHACLDFWHADGHGEYDNEGYNLRGHQYTDKNGRYLLETVRPSEYMFRAAHIHAKVRVTENSPVLTTQLFFTGEKKNATDPIFETLTVMDVADTKDGQKAAFDFVVDVDWCTFPEYLHIGSFLPARTQHAEAKSEIIET